MGLPTALLSLGLFSFLTPASGVPNDLIFVSEVYSQVPQRLAFYNWYGNVRLFRFQVPTDTVFLRWILQASRQNKPQCQNIEITVHFRYGAPPVINPLGDSFASNTSVPFSFNRTLTFVNSVQNNTFLNVSNPMPGPWFIAAHLPKDQQNIEIQGFTESCMYVFQPELFVLREVDMPTLQVNAPNQCSVGPPRNQARYKIFIPEYTQELLLQLLNCTLGGIPSLCPLQVTVGYSTQPQSVPYTIKCTGSSSCRVFLNAPPWNRWIVVMVESSPKVNANVSFEIVYSLPVCKPGAIGPRQIFTILNSLNTTDNSSLATGNQASPTNASPSSPDESSNSCLHKYTMIRADLDVVSVRFQSVSSSFIPVVPSLPSMMLFNLNSEMDSGGMFVVNLQLNTTTLKNRNATVMACLSAGSPVLTLNTSLNCTTAFFQGLSFVMNSSVWEGTRNIPYPETDNWYLSMQLVCPENDSVCQGLSARVLVSAYLNPCLNDCGSYGECRLLRRNGYMFAACVCKAGWTGWSCTDDTNALSVGHQIMATLLLTLSNLMFVPTIAVALSHLFFVEAAVYVYTMFFSTFYHACDQPGVAVMCIMDYDTLQYCDFFGSVVAIWVTILCMARLKTIPKYVLFLLGTLFIAMSMQLNRSGIWNMMGPCLFAFIVLVIAWTYRGVRRRHCYPPSWRRWVFFLIPGIALALIAISIYVFAETQTNYFYTHSLWHILVAGSVAFLLPPREKKKKSWRWRDMVNCRYKICKDDREELYVVT
ncbi:post-GPI attachment to proteins factor 6 [Pelobates fuscus]|uniref:post-GPI attachment to proteins factor 6 n=1 Tax=Pelobates fuscus TaxID=191477 RepID=UPI002FE49DE8